MSVAHLVSHFGVYTVCQGCALVHSGGRNEPAQSLGTKFAVWSRATWTTISAGFVPSTVKKQWTKSSAVAGYGDR